NFHFAGHFIRLFALTILCTGSDGGFQIKKGKSYTWSQTTDFPIQQYYKSTEYRTVQISKSNFGNLACIDGYQRVWGIFDKAQCRYSRIFQRRKSHTTSRENNGG